MKKIFSYILVFAIIVLSCSGSGDGNPPVKNIILIIGDGMGLTQVYSSMITTKEKLNIERAQFIGLSKTYSLNSLITDSGAGATAISTGHKANNHVIAVDTNGKPMKTIMEYASEAGLSNGIVVTCDLAHATPAAFLTHNIFRENYIDITKNYLHANFDILIGGGIHRFDSLLISDSLRMKGCQVVYSLDSVNISNNGPIVCMVAQEHLPSETEGRGNYLVKATDLALNRLNRNPKGFFMMIEGSQIDWACHANDYNYLVSEVLDLDKAIGRAFDFADKNPGTLVIVTADHETGGLTMPADSITGEINANFSSHEHTGVMVPIYAYGTGAKNFSQIMENTDLFYRMMKSLRLKN
jgi:alkaline phosphatase